MSIIITIIIHKSILSSQLYHDNSQGDVKVDLTIAGSLVHNRQRLSSGKLGNDSGQADPAMRG